MSTEITITSTTIDINVTEYPITIEAPSGAYPLPTSVYSVFGRTGNVVAAEGDYTLTQLAGVTITSPISGQALVYNGTSWVNNTETFVGTVTNVSALTIGTTGTDLTSTVANSTTTPVITLNVPTASATNRGALSSADWSTFNAKQVALNGTGFVKISGTTISYDNSNYYLASNPSFYIPLTALSSTATGLTYTNTTGVFSTTAGYAIPTTTKQATWDTAYNDSIVSAAVTGTTTKTLTLNQQDGGTVTANWTDDNTDAVTSVFGRTGAVVATSGDYNTLQVTENTNLYFTEQRARFSISGSSASGVVYSNTTGIIALDDIPNTSLFNDSVTINSKTVALGGSTTLSTTDIGEGTNLYFTTARAQAAISGTAPISVTSGVVSISQSSASTNGYLSSADWITFNSKQNALTLGNLTSTDITVTGGTGSVIGAGSTLTLATVNTNTGTFGSSTAIPVITVNGKGLITALTTTAVSIPSGSLSFIGDVTGTGTTGSDTTLTLATVNTNVGAYGTSTSVPTITVNAKGLVTAASQTAIPSATSSVNGLLTSTDWSTFNGKQNALNGTGFVKVTGTTVSYDNSTYLTTIEGIAAGGELSGTYASPSLVNSAVTGKVLTGVNITGGTIADTDSILTAFGKVQNQINGLIGGSIYKGTWDASTNTPTLTSSVGTAGNYYIVSVAGTTNLNGITDWQVGDWVIYQGTEWEKVDNTDAVVSVNGFTGAVSLTTSNISEGTNLYYTDTRARASISGSTGISYNSTSGVITNSAPDQTVSLTASTGISTSGTYPSFTITNTAPDQTVALTSGTGISATGTYPNFTITNTAPDQTVALTQGGTTTITGTYPNFTISSADQYVGTVTSIGITESVAALSITGSPVTTSGNINIGFAGASSQYVAGDGSLVTFPSIPSISGLVPYTGATQNVDLGTHSLTAADLVINHVSGSGVAASITKGGNGEALTVVKSSGSGNAASITGGVTLLDELHLTTDLADAYIASATTWNAKQSAITLTTTSNSGASTFISNTLNIPTYTLAGLGGINLSSLSATSPLLYDNTTGVFSIQQSSGSQAGFLSSADWTTFNSKQGAITLTTTGSSGAATLVSNTLNIPTYTLSGLGGVPTSRTLTINGTGYDLSADRSWTIPTSVNATFTQDYTATAAQTTFTVTGGYTVGQLAVYYNGSKLASAEFTATNGTTFVLATACQVNDIVQAVVEITGGGIGGSGTTNYVSKFTASGVLGNSLIFDNGTNVGIGNTNTSYTLDVSGTGRFTSTLLVSGAATFGNSVSTPSITNGGQFKMDYGANALSRSWRIISDSYNFGDFSIQQSTTQAGTTYADKLIITAAGNVGIGTSSPASLLHLQSSASGGQNLRIQTSIAAGRNYIQFANGSGDMGYMGYGGANGNFFIVNQLNADMLFYTNDTERMRITSGGNVGIGTSTVNCKFQVLDGQMGVGSTGSGGQGLYLFINNALSDNSYLSRASAGSGTTTWYIGNQSITTSSDIRLKENIIDTTRVATEIINKIRVVDHSWNDPSDTCINNKNSRGLWMGVIAQEAIEHIPWLVNKPLEDESEDGSKNYWHMDYAYSVPLLMKAIQELSKQNEELSNRLIKLENK
jgi:hypothetical protein